MNINREFVSLKRTYRFAVISATRKYSLLFNTRNTKHVKEKANLEAIIQTKKSHARITGNTLIVLKGQDNDTWLNN